MSKSKNSENADNDWKRKSSSWIKKRSKSKRELRKRKTWKI